MKKFMPQVLFLMACWSIEVTSCERSTLNYTMQLTEDLTENYDKRLRPIHDQHNFVTVNMDFSLVMIRSFDDVSGEITLLGTFKMSWIEERLTWTQADYGNISQIILPKSEVWHPDLFLQTSLNTLSHPGKAASTVNIRSGGRASMTSTDLLTSICPADVTDYPNDYQTCRLTVTPNGYNQNQMKIGQSESVIHNVSNNNEWDILAVFSSVDNGQFEIEIRLKRLSTYATMTMTVPIQLLGILNPWVFFLPPDSGERTSYSITTFLAFTVYMGILTDNMPKGSLPMANLMFQVFVMLIYSVVILLCTIISLQIHTNEGKKTVPSFVQKITKFLTLACLRNRKTTISSMDSTTPDEEKRPISAIEENRTAKEKFSLQRYSSGYLAQANLPQITEKEQSKTLVKECPRYPASYEGVMTWTQVGNVFDAYMLLLFGLWFIILTVYFSV